ncbi:MAG: lysine exporter LysO family protein [Bacteroidales bacterium]
MKNSFCILGLFFLGVLLGKIGYLPSFLLHEDYTTLVLYLLMFLVGMQIGSDQNFFSSLKNLKKTYFLLPLATIFGTLAGVAIASFWTSRWSLSDCMAVGSGFGYYSLSSILITQSKGIELGSIALISNIIRELFALSCAPLLAKFTGKLSPISVGGATTMDTTLPVILRYSGKEYLVVSIFHGFVVDFSVPFLVSFFCSI